MGKLPRSFGRSRTASVALAACALSVSACVTVTAPVLAGKDTYMMGLGARGGFSSDAELVAQTISAAGAFCTSQHRTIRVLSTTSAGTQMWTPQSNQVMFKCETVAEADAASKPALE